MSRKSDLRTFKTLNAIEISFTNLISTKAFRDITINDIAKGAVINRSTFYLHYTDKYKLLDTLVNQKIRKVMETISSKAHIKNGKLDYSLFAIDLTNSLKVVAEHAQLYRFILNDSESLGLRKKTELALGKKLSKSFPLETTITRDLLIEIVSSIYISVISWWLNNGMKYSAQFMASELVQFFELGSKSLLI
ncbi:TetR/AcrR family transcriptional regulator [Lentilactobacillus hilgardii]|uniref:TetR/AcrR family transcriptional regulator n=1 Tax=Lentilactobacillus hilgardii TaxID=1588 RepID=UPI0021A85939|nr:TetR/AcrR family transcriptional regulator [Lentilactobacillus hilgardii]MCT3396644.1 TetR/AcrR family transcriptional regulator [Lentilactobacillus hilgardii]